MDLFVSLEEMYNGNFIEVSELLQVNFMQLFIGQVLLMMNIV